MNPLDLSALRERIISPGHLQPLSSAGFLPECSPGLRQAAVLVLFHQEPGEARVLLTRRSVHLPTHAGQISFPGGSVDPGDDSVSATALREAHEEVGLPPHVVDVAGAMPAVELPSGYTVTPVLGFCEALPALSPDPAEVAEIFSLPVAYLLKEGLFQRGTRTRNNIKREFYYFDFKEYYIWGSTASMLHALAQRLKQE